MKITLLYIIISIIITNKLLAEIKNTKDYKDVANHVLSGGSKEEYANRCAKLVEVINKLSDEDKNNLYDLLVSEIDRFADDPFANQDIWLLINIILSQSNNNLIVKILKKSPPRNVGFQSLDEYLNNLPKEILARIVLEGAQERSTMEMKLNKTKSPK